MNKLLILIAITAIAALSSCCKEACINENDLSVSFYNFTVSDADTVLYVRYQPGTTTPLDSNWKYQPLAPSNTSRSALWERLPANSDWQIFIPAVNKQYYITDIVTGTADCSCERGQSTVIRQYKVNHTTTRQGNFLVLD
jgi:hypothetical protein